MDSSRVGDVVNGHVWTGTEWEVAPPPPPAKPKYPVVIRDDETWATGLNKVYMALMVILWLGVAGVIAGPSIAKWGDELQVQYGSGASGPPGGLPDFVRGLGALLNNPMALWVLIPVAIGVTVLAAMTRPKDSGHQRATEDDGP